MSYEELGHKVGAALYKIKDGSPVETFLLKLGNGKSVQILIVDGKHKEMFFEACRDLDSFKKKEQEDLKADLRAEWEIKLNG